MASKFPLNLAGFEPIRRIGAGGFGEVWLARQRSLDREVAIKVGFQPLDTSAVKRRFERECIALGRLSSSGGTVDVYSSGVSDNGLPYLIMEYIDGGSLVDRLGKLSEAALIKVGVELCSALVAAHSLGILHRDLKPANVFMRSNGEAVVGDFGVARLGDGNNTTTNQVVASVAYAAPEVLDGSEPSAAADIYGIGVTLASVLLGRSPFSSSRDDSVSTIVRRVVTGRHEDLARSGVSTGLAAVLTQTISLEPTHRPPSAAALQQMLAELPNTDADKTRVSGNSKIPIQTYSPPIPNIASTSVQNISLSRGTAHKPKESDATPLRETPSSKKVLFAGLAAAVLAVAGTGMFMILGSDNDPTPAATPSTAVTIAATQTSTRQPNAPTTTKANPPEPREVDQDPSSTSAADDAALSLERINFVPGTSSGSAEGSVAGTELDGYILEAEAGQVIVVSLESVMNNATFTVMAPDGSILATASTAEELQLPMDGDYSVVVGTSASDASYVIDFSIT